MLTIRLGKNRTWTQEGVYRGSGNVLSIALLENDAAAGTAKVAVTIESLTRRACKLVDKGELYICLANWDMSVYMRYYRYRAGEQDLSLEGWSDRMYWRTINGFGRSSVIERVVRGKNTYTFSLEIEYLCDFLKGRGLRRTVVDYAYRQKPTYVRLKGRLIHIYEDVKRKDPETGEEYLFNVRELNTVPLADTGTYRWEPTTTEIFSRPFFHQVAWNGDGFSLGDSAEYVTAYIDYKR